MDGITDSMDMGLGELQELVMDREVWHAAIHGKYVLNPCVRKISWRRKWQPTPVFLPGKSYGQRRLVGYSPWGCKELDTIE